MNLNRKSIVVIGSVALILGIFIFNKGGHKKTGEIILNKDKIKLEDVMNSATDINFENENSTKYFSSDNINYFTGKYFSFLQDKFKEFEKLEDHLETVRKYLYSVMDPSEADKLFTLYKKYCEYQEDILDKSKLWGTPSDGEDAIEYLRKLREYQVDYFGEDMADSLFGTDVKSQEYQIRRNLIINDKNLYSSDKFSMIQSLNSDMWGNDSTQVEDSIQSYKKYLEYLKIYDKDFSDMKADEKNAKIKDIRLEIFPADIVAKLEDVDKTLAVEEQTEADYRSKEKVILENEGMSAEQKQAALKKLQKESFGDEAEAFERRENIRKGLEEAKAPFQK